MTIATRTDEQRGMVNYTVPLEEALLGLHEGEIAHLAIPGRPTVRLRIIRIERDREVAAT